MSLNKWENLQNLQILDKVLGLPPQVEEPKTFTSQATVLIQTSKQVWFKTVGKSTVYWIHRSFLLVFAEEIKNTSFSRLTALISFYLSQKSYYHFFRLRCSLSFWVNAWLKLIETRWLPLPSPPLAQELCSFHVMLWPKFTLIWRLISARSIPTLQWETSSLFPLIKTPRPWERSKMSCREENRRQRLENPP